MCVCVFHGVVFIPKPHLSWVSLRLVRWISAPQGLLQLKYFNLTKHLIYFISPMRKAVCLNRACQPTAPFTAIYRQPGTLKRRVPWFCILSSSRKHLKAAIHCYCMWHFRTELAFYGKFYIFLCNLEVAQLLLPYPKCKFPFTTHCSFKIYWVW